MDLERGVSPGFPPGWADQDIWAHAYARDSRKSDQARLLRTIEILYTKDASEKLHSKLTESERRSQLNYYRRNGAVLSVPGTAAHRYPAFQFDEESGDLPEIVVLANRRLLHGGEASEEDRWAALRWWCSSIEVQGKPVSPSQAIQDGTLTREILDTLLPPREDE